MMAESQVPPSPPPPPSKPICYPGASVPWQYGWRLYTILTTLFLSLFLSTLETTIIATALVSISSDLGGFQESNWIPVAYLITYTGFLVVFARLSDIYGRKVMLIFSVSFFLVFSAACGAAQNMRQLIVLRAFQGIGGSGIYGCVMGTLREVSPPNTYGRVTGMLGVVFGFSSFIGPLLGGAIVARTTWRWVFLLNLPPCLVIIGLLAAFFPGDMRAKTTSSQKLKKIDHLGVVSSLAGTTLLIYALETGSLSQTWSNVSNVVCFALAALFWLVFGSWETLLHFRTSHSVLGAIVPVFPVRLAKHRVIGFTMLAGLLSGFAFFAVLINLPQRYQIVNRVSATRAGVNLIPLLVLSAFGAGSTGWVCARYALDWYVLIASCSLQIISLGLLSTLSTTRKNIQAAEFGYEAMLGLGFGSFNTCIILIARSTVEGKDQAVTIGAITQTRTLGGVIGLAVSQVVLFNNLLGSLRGKITKADLKQFFDSVNALDALGQEKAALISHEYAAGFNIQMRTTMYFTIAALIASLLTWRKDAMTFDQANQAKMKAAEASPIGSVAHEKELVQVTMTAEASVGGKPIMQV